MDPLISAAANALAAGDPLRALNCVALREDPPALALRGIAMARLGDFPQARSLLKRAARAFGTKNPLPHARCVLAEAEIAFVSRDLAWPVKSLETARTTLERHGDLINAIHARHLMARRALLLGETEAAERVLAGVNPAILPPARRAAHEMITADLALRRLRVATARQAYVRALEAASRSGIAPLRVEVEKAAGHLDTAVARLTGSGGERPLLLEDVEALLASGSLVIDACRRVVRRGKVVVPLAGRPVLFSLVRALAEAAPGDTDRISLLKTAFGARHADESHRVRLRVEIARLRQLLLGLAEIRPRARASCSARRVRRISTSSPGRWKRNTEMFSPFWRTARPGPAPRSRSPSASANEPCSGRWTPWRRKEKSARSGTAAPAAGLPPPSPDSRPQCYSR